MIEDNERSWKSTLDKRFEQEAARAMRQYVGAVFLAIALTPALLDGLLFGYTFIAPEHPHLGPDRPTTEMAGKAIVAYFVMLIVGLPALIPAAMSHVICAWLMKRRGWLSWPSAGASGALHGVLALLLFAAIFSTGSYSGWLPLTTSALMGHGAFALAGAIVGLVLHAAFPVFRRPDRRTTAP